MQASSQENSTQENWSCTKLIKRTQISFFWYSATTPQDRICRRQYEKWWNSQSSISSIKFHEMGCRFKGRYERLTYYKREDLIEKSDILINQTQQHINTTDHNQKTKQEKWFQLKKHEQGSSHIDWRFVFKESLDKQINYSTVLLIRFPMISTSI